MSSSSIKESFAFNKDIDWMMGDFDLRNLCERMGWKIDHDTGTHIVTFCPDHEMHTGRIPSHPKFYIDKKTGKTQCKTEGRGSNILHTVKRVLNCSTQDAYKHIVGTDSVDSLSISWKALKRKLENLNNKDKDFDEDEEEEQNNTIAERFSEIKSDIIDGKILESGYKYFMYPPNKKPTLINKDTLHHFKCFQRDYGYYNNRVIIPIYLKNSLTSFVAQDILGEEEWQKHNTKPAAEYKKVLYPKGSKTGSNLFNYDSLEDGAEFIILVEGARDAMKLWQMGLKNTVAILGTNLSALQSVLISKKYPFLCYIMLDGDDAGIAAATKIAKKLNNFMDVKVAIPPRGHDPKTLDEPLLLKTLGKARLIK